MRINTVINGDCLQEMFDIPKPKPIVTEKSPFDDILEEPEKKKKGKKDKQEQVDFEELPFTEAEDE